jgi:hypothetical protein
MTEASGAVGACPECGRPMRVVEVDRVADADRTRILGGRPGRPGPRDLSELVLRVMCDAGHVWWLAQDG